MPNSVLERLQQWYADQCDGEWEHTYGVSVGTLDNPGWQLKIDLAGTALEHEPFEPVEHGLEVEGATDWHRVWVEDRQFHGAGDPTKLAFMLDCFLTWAGQGGGG